MDLNYLLNDYREGFGLGPPSWEKPPQFIVKFDRNDENYWVMENGQKVCPVEEGFPPEEEGDRSSPRTFHHAGRAFVVGYYHGGGPGAWVREVDS